MNVILQPEAAYVINEGFATYWACIHAEFTDIWGVSKKFSPLNQCISCLLYLGLH